MKVLLIRLRGTSLVRTMLFGSCVGSVFGIFMILVTLPSRFMIIGWLSEESTVGFESNCKASFDSSFDMMVCEIYLINNE
jgi:hypothetical protein